MISTLVALAGFLVAATLMVFGMIGFYLTATASPYGDLGETAAGFFFSFVCLIAAASTAFMTAGVVDWLALPPSIAALQP